MTGTQLNKEIVQLLNLAGHHVWRQNTGGHLADPGGPGRKRRWVKYGVTGCPDVIGFSKRGRFIAIEGKVGRDKLKHEQNDFLLALGKARGIALVAHETTEGLIERVESLDARFEAISKKRFRLEE